QRPRAPAASRGVSGRLQTYLGLLGAGLLAQGAISLLLRAGDRASSDGLARFVNADPLHATVHVLWGVTLLVLVWRRPSDPAAAHLAVVFGVFYTGLAIAGLTFHHPLGLELDRGENVFHLLVGPTSLVLGLVALRPLAAQEQLS